MSPGESGFKVLEHKLGYRFTDKGLLMEALTHKSYHYENRDSSEGFNERLEFLGDSVLGLSVAGELFGRLESFDESMMSKLKSYLVKGEVLSDVALGLGLGDYLRLGRGEEDSGGRTKRSLLANAMEAIIGAVYAESGYDEARALVLRLFRGRLDEAIETDLYKDYKSELQEASQEIHCVLPVYRVVEEEGPEHEKTFLVEVHVGGRLLGTGKGLNKKEAQQSAAREALGLIRGS